MMSLNPHLSEAGEGFNQGNSSTLVADEVFSMNKDYSKELQNEAVKAFYTWIIFFHYLMLEIQVLREH